MSSKPVFLSVLSTLLLAAVATPAFSCAISSAYYRKIPLERWDFRQTPIMLYQDYELSDARHTDEIQLKFSRTHKIKQRKNAYFTDILNAPIKFPQYRYPDNIGDFRPREMTVFLEVYNYKRLLKTGRTEQTYLRGRFQITRRTLKPEDFGKTLKLRMHEYAPNYRLLFVFKFEKPNNPKPKYVAYVSAMYVMFMPHCGHFFPVTPSEYPKYCKGAEEDNGKLCRH